MDSEEEALFRSYPYALYFVQSPSTISRANTVADDSSPTRSTTTAAQRFTLSHYSSSRGSTNSFLHEKKTAPDHDPVADADPDTRMERFYDGTTINVGGGDGEKKAGGGDTVGEEEYDEGEDEDYYGNSGGGWWRKYFSFRDSPSCGWIALQIGLRAVVSFGIALMVFYIATKPTPPDITLKMNTISVFELAEGVDTTGIITKILTTNCSVELVVGVKSKVFGLHIHPPVLTMSLHNLPFAISKGIELYAFNDGSTSFLLYVGIKNKPMYGAGRTMEDILQSGKSLPLTVHVSLHSSFHIIPKLVTSKFHHEAECLLLLSTIYDKKHKTLHYTSHCSML